MVDAIAEFTGAYRWPGAMALAVFALCVMNVPPTHWSRPRGAQASDFQTYVVADACGGLTLSGHDLALQRMRSSGAVMTSWLQVLLELQRDWTRQDTYQAARAIIERNGGGYGIGLNYARDMLPSK